MRRAEGTLSGNAAQDWGVNLRVSRVRGLGDRVSLKGPSCLAGASWELVVEGTSQEKEAWQVPAEETYLKTQCIKGISPPAGPGLPGTCPVSVPNISNLRKPIPG